MISKLHLENFKCFVNQDIDFSPLTILVGTNGAGKSTVIQSILLLFQSLEIPCKVIENETGFCFDISLNGPYLLQLGQAAHVLSSNPTSNDIVLEIVDENGESLSAVYSSEQKYAAHLLEGRWRNMDFENILPDTNSFAYLNAERFGPRKALEMGHTSSDSNVGYQGEYVSYVIREMDLQRITLPESLKREEASASFSSQVEAWFNTIIPNVKVDYDVIEKMNMIALGYKNMLLDTDFVSPANTGFGISYVLPIVVAGLSLATKTNPIFIVENPEAHLHPYSQSKIGRFLATLALAGVQVIVETHSEHVVNGCRLEMLKMQSTEQMKINFVTHADPEGNQVTPIQVNRFGELSEWPKGFFDQEEQDMKEMIQLRKGLRGQ